MCVRIAALRGRKNACRAGVIDEMMADLDGWGRIAASDAGRANNANARPGGVLELMQQFFCAKHRAGQGIAHADRQRRDVRLAFLHHVEMRIEGGRLKHFGKRQFHLIGERRKMRRGNLTIGVLDQVQKLDQQVAPPRAIAQQKLDLARGMRVDLAPLRCRFGPPPSLAGMLERPDRSHIICHKDTHSPNNQSL